MKALLLRHRHLTAAILLGITLVVVWFFESKTGHGWRLEFWQWATEMHDMLADAPPAIYFSAMGLLPLLGIPMVGFYLLSASLYAPHLAILGTAYAILLNLLVSYAIGRLGRRWIARLVARTGRRIPQVSSRHHIWMTAAVRVAPGAPLMVQNYLLVLAGVSLPVFVLVSLPLELLIGAGYVLLGRSLFTGNWKLLLLAAAVVLVAILVFRFLRKRSAQKGDAYTMDATPVDAATSVEPSPAGCAVVPDTDAAASDAATPDTTVGDATARDTTADAAAPRGAARNAAEGDR